MSEDFQNYVDWMDFSNVTPTSGGGDPPAVGSDYMLEVVEVEKTKTNKTGAPQVRLSCKVIGPDTELGNANKDKRISGWYTLDPNAKDFVKGRTASVLLACGLPLQKFNLNDFLGKKFKADVNERMIDDNKNPGQKVAFRSIQNERAL